MREIRFEYLRPRQILEAMKEKSIVYLFKLCYTKRYETDRMLFEITRKKEG